MLSISPTRALVARRSKTLDSRFIVLPIATMASLFSAVSSSHFLIANAIFATVVMAVTGSIRTEENTNCPPYEERYTAKILAFGLRMDWHSSGVG